MSGLTKYGLLFFFLIVMVTVSIFGSYAGYEVNGVPQEQWETGKLQLDWWNPLTWIVDVLNWIWGCISFLFYMVTFQIDGMPGPVSMIFIVTSLMVAFLIISLIRGTE